MTLAITELRRVTNLIDKGQVVTGLLIAQKIMRKETLLFQALERRAEDKAKSLGSTCLLEACAKLCSKQPELLLETELLRVEREALANLRTVAASPLPIPQSRSLRDRRLGNQISRLNPHMARVRNSVLAAVANA